MRSLKCFKTLLLSASLLMLLSGCGTKTVVHRAGTNHVALETVKIKVASGDADGKPIVTVIEIRPGDLIETGPTADEVKKAIGVE